MRERDATRLTGSPTPPKIGRMEQELSALEAKLDTLVRQVQTLRADNLSLRERVATLETENQRLKSKVELATSRIESVLAMIPDGAVS